MVKRFGKPVTVPGTAAQPPAVEPRDGDLFGIKKALERRQAQAATPAPRVAPPAKGKSKPVAKGKTLTAKDLTGKALTRARDGLIATVRNQQRLKFGEQTIWTGKQLWAMYLTLPILSNALSPTCHSHPGNLAFEWLLGLDGWPLGIFMTLVGKPSVGKSTLGFEFLRWFDAAGGVGEIEEVETKISDELLGAIVGHEAYDRITVTRCESVEHWQEQLTFSVQRTKEYMDGRKQVMPTNPKKKKRFGKSPPLKAAPEPKRSKGPGRLFPGIWLVDTITGKMSRDSQADIVDKGSAGRSHPVEALSISRYVRTASGLLDNWPFSVVFVNQLKTAQKPGQMTVDRQLAGGAQVLFQESLELELSRAGKFNTARYDGYYVQIKLAKNSLAHDDKKIKVRVIRWEDTDASSKSGWRLRMMFDWDWATVALLLEGIEGRFAANLKEINFHLKAEGGETAWSTWFGHKDKGDAVSWSEMGALIRQDSRLMDLLRTALRISKRPRMSGDYIQQRNKLRKQVD